MMGNEQSTRALSAEVPAITVWTAVQLLRADVVHAHSRYQNQRLLMKAVPSSPVEAGLVARAIISPRFLLNVGTQNHAISLPYIQSSADLSELMAGSR